MARRWLGVLVEVEPGEGGRLVASALSMFLVMTSYYVLKPVRSSMFIEQFGADRLPLVYCVGALLTFLATLAYNRLVDRYDRAEFTRRVFLAVSLFWAATWVFSFVPGLQGAVSLAIYFFVYVYVLFITALFWSLNHALWTPEQAGRLYGTVFLGGQAGQAAGGFVAHALAPLVGTLNLLGVSLGIFALAYLATRALERSGGRPPGKAKRQDEGRGSLEDVRDLLRHPYARRIGLLVVCSTMAVSCINFQFEKTLELVMPDRDARTAFEGRYYAIGGGLNIALLLASGRLVRALGPGVGLVSLPLVALAAAALLLGAPSLTLLAWLWAVEHSVSYTLYGVGKEVLYVPTDDAVKFKYKALNDAFGYRLGYAAQAAYIVGYQRLVSTTALGGLGLGILAMCFVWVPAALRAHGAWRELRDGSDAKAKVPAS